MRNLHQEEINTISGGMLTQGEIWLLAIAAVGTTTALVCWSINKYESNIDFSKMTPEEAYQKGKNDGYAYGLMFPVH